MLSHAKNGMYGLHKYISMMYSYPRLAILCSATIAAIFGYTKINSKKSKLVIDNNGYVDDVTGMNKTSVTKIFQPTCVDDITDAINEAIRNGKQISMFGQRHTMGGHIVAKDGIVLDMTRYDKVIDFNKEERTITVQPGITWAKLIHYLDQHGLSPMVLQSYATFSVGGSIGANIHGITSDDSLVSSIVSLKVATGDGTIVECSRTKNGQLFSLVVGGYGLFGVVVEATLKVVENSQLSMETKRMSPQTFVKEYMPLVDNPEIGIKLGRIDVSKFNEFTLFAFKKEETEVSSNVASKPHVASKPMQLAYKWIADTYIGQRIRSATEKILGRPLDWSITCDTNGSLYESADPLTTLWSPIFNRNKTHILQEYFIPANGKSFEDWSKSVGEYFQGRKFKNVALLNATIRFVKKDSTTFLNYAKDDMFAVVLYYRLDKLHDGDIELQEINKYLTELALSHGGTFYLPYRHHYSIEKLREAYPQWDSFVRLKHTYDAHNVFSNEWWKAYSANCSTTNLLIPHIDPSVEQFRDNIVQNYSNVLFQQLRSDFDRHRFVNFTKYVFNMADYKDTVTLIESGKSEREIYEDLSKFVSSRSFITNILSGLRVLNTQKTELVGETINLMKKLGKTTVNGYISIGDCGRYVKGIKKGLHITGPTYIVHDKQSFVQDSVERGSAFSRGKFVSINYDNVSVDFLKDVKDGSVELVTLYIGLHHFTPSDLHKFLGEVKRVLSPNGVFILRDHNATEDVKPLLSFAHTYFNALTGVSWEDNSKEVRNFTTIKQLREIMQSYGFNDNGFYEKQLHDPTENFLMAFSPQTAVPNKIREVLDQSKSYKRSKVNGYHTVSEWASVDIFQTFGNSMNHTPFYKFPYFSVVKTYWKLFFEQTKECAKQEGLKNTLMSDGILMDMMLGTFVTAGFIPLGILCAPMKWWYAKPSNADYSTQEVIISTNNVPLVPEELNGGRILKSWEAIGNTYYHVELPRYKPFTKTMVDLSKSNNFNIVEIGNCESVSIKVSYSGEVISKSMVDSLLAQSDGTSWGKITSVYKMTEHDRTMIIINIKVDKLLDFVRSLEHDTVFSLEHIHDP